jgi:hypothetical protein
LKALDAERDTFPKLLRENARRIGGKVAIREKDWSRYFDEARLIAHGLAALGFARGDRVAIVGDNRPVLLAEQNATMALQVAQQGYVMENGRIVLDGDAKTISQNEDIKEFYLGLTGVGQRKSHRDVKHYRRRKRWLS